ncbi:hypothetical protein SESBI_44680 [Sesbania bispinosa]|nr:hypothetical protein SESBI_44680 [Sesbania bispinosa]
MGKRKDIGKKWKDFRLRLFDKYYKREKTRAENISNPPLTIPKDDWAEFIDYRLSQKTMEKICEIESLDTTPTNVSPNDSLGQVFGKEHPGRVRGMGIGVCPTQVFGYSHQRFYGTIPPSSIGSGSSNSGLKSEVEQLRSKVESDAHLIKEMASTIVFLCQKRDVPLPTNIASVLSDESLL